MEKRRAETARPHREEIAFLGLVPGAENVVFEDLPDWQALGGYCARCEREGWVDRWAVSKKWGKTTFLGSLARLLWCRECGNKGNNKWIFGRLPR
jgi:hypothetical protein